jgi:hypothetical protein
VKTTTTDVILAAGPTVVAVVAIAAAVWQQWRGFDYARKMADLADTRKVVDDAAVALYDASRALSGLERAFFNFGSSFRIGMPEAFPDAEQAGATLKSIRGRLRVRLGGALAAIAAFGDAHDATRDAVNAAAAQDPSPSADIPGAGEVGDAHRRLLAATEDFMRAATETVGAQLP